MIQALLDEGARVRLYDPQAMANMQKKFPASDRVVYAQDPYEAAEGAHALAVLTEWDVFRHLDFQKIRQLMTTPILLDARNLYDPTELHSLGFEYYGMGR